METSSLLLQDGEVLRIKTGRKTEWSTVILCSFSGLFLFFLGFQVSGLWKILLLAGGPALLLYSVWLILAGKREWAAVTDRRLVVMRLTLPALKEKIVSFPLEELESYRLFQSARAGRRQEAAGDIAFFFENGRTLNVPALREEDLFLDIIRQWKDDRREESEAEHAEE